MRRVRWTLVVLAALTAAPAAHAGGTPEVCPDAARQMLADARAMLGRGDAGGALTKVKAAAEIAPRWPRPHAEMGLVYQRMGDRERGLEHYARYQLSGLVEPGCEPDDLTREMAEAEALLVYLVNEERTSRGIAPLSPDATLTEMARTHSDEMRELGYFSHGSPVARNRSLQRRYENAFNDRPRALAENVSRMAGTLWSFIPENIRDSHQRLMESPGHRSNILWERVNAIGVGISVNDSGDYWITEDFALLDD